MKVELKAGHPVYDAMTDLFKFHRDFGETEERDGYWLEIVDAVTALNNKYRDTEVHALVSRHLITAMVMLDKKAKEKGVST